MTQTKTDKIKELLEKKGFEEKYPGTYCLNDVVVDLVTGETPKIGTMLNGELQEEGHGLQRVYDLRNEIMWIWNPKPKHQNESGNTLKPSNTVGKNLPSIPKNVQNDLSVENILKYINPMATEQEAYMFLQLCKHRGLNPFLKDAYLIKYSEKDPAAFVVSKDAFLKRADQLPDFKGFEAGIIVQKDDGSLEKRQGSFILPAHELLVGGWATVHREGRADYHEEVTLNEYRKKTRTWDTMPATMIRKVPIVHALREAFPQEFAGMYDLSEVQNEEQV